MYVPLEKRTWTEQTRAYQAHGNTKKSDALHDFATLSPDIDKLINEHKAPAGRRSINFNNYEYYYH